VVFTREAPSRNNSTTSSNEDFLEFMQPSGIRAQVSRVSREGGTHRSVVVSCEGYTPGEEENKDSRDRSKSSTTAAAQFGRLPLKQSKTNNIEQPRQELIPDGKLNLTFVGDPLRFLRRGPTAGPSIQGIVGNKKRILRINTMGHCS